MLSSKTLVIILSQTRVYEHTFDNFKKNVIDELNADLCICIGTDDNYNYNNPFYKLAKYKYLYKEPEDYGDAFDYALKEISKESNNFNLKWRQFLQLKSQIWGGVKNDENQHLGSAGILIFYRWFLLKNLKQDNLINEYDRFIITRSDFIYRLPHPKLELLDENNIWVPDEEHYGGYTDRHVVLSKNNISKYLDIFDSFVLKSEQYLSKMLNKDNWNLEQLIKFHLEEHNIIDFVKEFPYIMYSIRGNNDSSRWTYGVYDNNLGYYIKYHTEYNKSLKYKNMYDELNMTINNFYIYLINR